MKKVECVAIHPGIIMKYILMSSGKTQLWLATQMGTSQASISRALNGKLRLSKSFITKFVKAINSSISVKRFVELQKEYEKYKSNKNEDLDYMTKKEFVSKNTNSENLKFYKDLWEVDTNV